MAILIAQYNTGYDIGVEEIFFNIWRKRRDFDYKFLKVKLRNLMVRWVDEENDGILDTKPPPPPQYFEAGEDDEVIEVAPPNKFPEQASLANAREEEDIASNPPSTEDEPAPITLDGATPIALNEVTPINVEEEEPTSNTTDDVPPA